jgi:adenylosuccinate synthase
VSWSERVSGPRIVAVSGRVGAGKSTLARLLAERYGARHIRTQDLMRERAEAMETALPNERRALQEFGERLDAETGGGWVAQSISETMASNDDDDRELLIIDAIRRKEQVDRLREVFPSRVMHIHLKAAEEILAQRYSDRDSHMAELPDYAQVAANATEAAVGLLENDADVVIDTARNTIDDVATRAVAALRLLPSRSARLVDVLVGGQYGSEGKGNIAYYLAPDYDILMRVGGPNAGHKVPTEPEPYTHRLLPSGTQANQDALLLIGPGATLDVDVLLDEIAECGVEASRLVIDPQAMIIEDEDKEAEAAIVTSIGSTGKGGGAAAARRIRGRNDPSIAPKVRLARDVPELAPYVRSTADVLDDAYAKGQRILLEGTQGTSLSLFHGDYPYVTSRDTTTAATLAEAGIAPGRVRRVVMVTRTYPIRVGSPKQSTSGPMAQETDWDEIAARSGHSEEDLRNTERGSVSGNKRRVSEFNWQQLRRAAELNGATDIALTFTDYLDKSNADSRRYDQLAPGTIQFIEEVERVAAAPVTLIGTRFDPRSVIDRRDW